MRRPSRIDATPTYALIGLTLALAPMIGCGAHRAATSPEATLERAPIAHHPPATAHTSQPTHTVDRPRKKPLEKPPKEPRQRAQPASGAPTAAKVKVKRKRKRPMRPPATAAVAPAVAPGAAAATVAVAAAAAAVPASAVDLSTISGGKHLRRLHPAVQAKAIALYRAAAEQGIALTFISGHRPFRPRSAKARKGRASWHAFGMAFDVNLAHRRNMKDALAHYDRDARQWRAVGRIAESLALIWGVQWGRHEVFHFEWHPGMPQAIRRPTLKTLLGDTGPSGQAIEKTWWRFPAPDHSTEHGH